MGLVDVAENDPELVFDSDPRLVDADLQACSCVFVPTGYAVHETAPDADMDADANFLRRDTSKAFCMDDISGPAIALRVV
jgi:hypothetical protein